MTTLRPPALAERRAPRAFTGLAAVLLATWVATPAAAAPALAGEPGPAPTRSARAPLLHAPDEEAALRAALVGPRLAPPRARVPVPDLTLSAILYVSPSNWVAWINGKPMRPGQTDAHYRIVAIDGREVKLAILGGDGSADSPVVTLRPHQVYLAADGRVIDRISFPGTPVTPP